MLAAAGTSARTRRPRPSRRTGRVPFGVGERLEYQVKFGKSRRPGEHGSPADGHRSRPRRLAHRLPHERRNSVLPRERSLRRLVRRAHALVASLLAGHRRRQLRAEAPLRDLPRPPRVHREQTSAPQPSVEHPLDEGTFLYFLRTVPLRVGMDTSSTTTSRPKKPGSLQGPPRGHDRGARRQKFSAIVVQPIFATRLFSEGGHAEVWLSDDENRIMLQMKSKLSFGSLSLYLKSYRPSPTTTTPLNRSPPRDTANALTLCARGGPVGDSNRSRRAAPKQGERRRIRASARRRSLVRRVHRMRSPTSSSRATSAPSSTRSSAPRGASVASCHARRPRREDGPRAAAHRSHAPRRHHAHRDERLGGDPRLRDRALRRDVGRRRRRTSRRHVRHGRGDRPRDERRVRRGMRAQQGMGESLGRALDRATDLANPELSLLLNALRLGVPATVHAALRRRDHPPASGRKRRGDRRHEPSRFSPPRRVAHRHSRRRRRVQSRQRGDNARGFSQGADHRAEPERRPTAQLRHRRLSTCSATIGRA